jgi:hypothetical protein
MPLFSTNSNSLACHLKTTWMRHAFTDPCLFHATLYTASAHLDASRGETNNIVTLFHHTEIIRLLNQRLTHSGTELDDTTIAAVVPLAYFEVEPCPCCASSVVTNDVNQFVNSNFQSSQAHKQGMLQMVKVKGGLEKLGFDGFLAGLILL